MSKVHDKNKILSLFSSSDIPKDLININKDHKEFLLAEKAAKPDLIGTILNISQGFIIEEQKRFEKGPPKSKLTKGGKQIGTNSNQQNDMWRPQDDPIANDFFDNFKGKTDRTKVKEFINEKKAVIEFQPVRENDIIINMINKVSTFTNLKYVVNRDEIFQEIVKKADPIVGSHLFKASNDYALKEGKKEEVKKHTSDKLKEPQVKKEINKNLSENQPRLLDGADPRVFQEECDLDFKKLEKINEKLNYPLNEPLWYIFHLVAKSSYGPLSSKEIEFMYRTKMLGKDSEVRLIDVFNLKGLKQFEFVKLVDIFEDSFINKVEKSSLFYLLERINNRKNEIVLKIEHKKDNETILQEDSIYNVNKLLHHTEKNDLKNQEDTKSLKSQNSKNSGNSNNKVNKSHQQNKINNENNNTNYYNNSHNNYSNYNYGQKYNNNYNNNGYNNYNNNYNNYNDYNEHNENYYHENQGSGKKEQQVDVNDLFSPNSDFLSSNKNNSASNKNNINSIYESRQNEVINQIPKELQQERPAKKNKGKPRDLDVKLGIIIVKQ